MVARLSDKLGEAEAREGLGEAQDGEQRARGRVAVRNLRLRLLLPHLRVHRRHILCTNAHTSVTAFSVPSLGIQIFMCQR